MVAGLMRFILLGLLVAEGCGGTSAKPSLEPPGTTMRMPDAGPQATEPCFTQGQFQEVMTLHQDTIRSMCWVHLWSRRPTVKVVVRLTILPDGSTQDVSASSDEPLVAKCVQDDVRRWEFPAQGCRQKVAFSYNFVRTEAPDGG
jgi:hypothetical protein